MDRLQQTELIAAALAARARAYAPYSQFLVGAAIRAADGRIFAGCNVENVSYGLTICAERVAAGSAIAAGARQFTAVAVVTEGGLTPCGACRQFLAEFGPDMTVLLIDAARPDEVTQTRLGELLPQQFHFTPGKEKPVE